MALDPRPMVGLIPHDVLIEAVYAFRSIAAGCIPVVVVQDPSLAGQLKAAWKQAESLIGNPPQVPSMKQEAATERGAYHAL